MSKRVMYSIPLAGLALTSVGCGKTDVLLNAQLTTDTAFGAANPYSLAQYDLSQATGIAGLVCDVLIDISDVGLTAYAGTLTNDLTLSACLLNGDATAGAAYNNTFPTVFDFTVTPDVAEDDKNVDYTIVLVDQAGNAADINLDCTLSGTALSCTDDQALDWEFTATLAEN